MAEHRQRHQFDTLDERLPSEHRQQHHRPSMKK
jgi:hypothetical protein